MVLRRLSLISLILMPASLGGCLTQPPRIEVESVEVTARGDEAMAIQFNLELSNLNDKPIEPLEFTYSVSIAGRGVYSGRHAAEMTLDAGGINRPLPLPAVIAYDRVGWQMGSIPTQAQWSLSGSLIYVDEGVLAETLLDLGYQPTAGFSATGTLETNRAPSPPGAREPEVVEVPPPTDTSEPSEPARP